MLDRLRRTCFVLTWLALLAVSFPALAQNLPAPFQPVVPTPAAQTKPAAPAATTLPPAASPSPAVPADQPMPMPPPAAVQVTEQVTKEGLDDLKSRVDAAADLSDAQKQAANEQIDKAKTTLAQADEFAANLKISQQRTVDIETERQAEQARVDAALREPQQHAAPYTPLPQLEQMLASKQQELLQAQTSLAQTEKSLADRAARQKAIKDRLAAIPAEVEQHKTDLARPDPGTDPPLLVAARRQRLQAELERLTNEPAALQAEAAFLAAQEAANLIQLRRQALNATVARLKDEVEEWQRDVLRAKSSDAKTRVKLSRAEAEAARIPQLKELYESNAQTVETEIDIRDKQKQLTDEIARTKTLRDDLTRTRKELETREASIGATTAFGIRLREQRKPRIAELNSLQQQIRDREPTLQQAQLDSIVAGEDRGKLDNLNKVIEDMLQNISPPDAGNDDRSELADEVRDAYEQRQKDLTELESTYQSYVSALEQLDAEQTLLVRETLDFQTYINQRILWVPTNRVLTLRDVANDAQGLQRLVDTNAWLQVWNSFKEDAFRDPALYFLAALVWIVLLLSQGKQRANIRKFGQKASSRLNTDMGPTWAAVVWTFLKTLVTPFPLLFLGWRGSEPGSGIQELSEYVFTISIWLWWLEMVRHVCRNGGLGPAHFQWPTRVNQVVSNQLGSFIGLATPVVLLAAILKSRSVEGGTDALQRCCSITFFLLLAYTLHRLTSHKNGIFQEWVEAHPNGWIDRLSALWHAAAVCLPLGLAVLTIAGYSFAVERLSIRLAQTLMLVFGAIFARALLFRWLTLRQRRLAVAHAREIRAALAEAQGQESGSQAAVLEAQEARTNLADVSTQSKRLLNTTIVTLSLVWAWYIWIDVLPALQKLDDFSIPGIPFTLSQILAAGLKVILFTTAARNIPGLLEITLLERLPLDRSVRYAIGAILRYAIIVLGMIAIGDSLAIEWEKLQWLVAALTFSLGFGLQEIFANFVSGIIMLFEQPVRVGDVVTLDNVTGSINRIRIRSTTIVDGERREYIVPNKEFITGKLLNWTLTDTINRIGVQVGVSYDADPQRVREILQKIITTQPHVLAEPSPNVSISSFGESAINFSISAYLPSLDFRQETTHMLYARIYHALREADIEIPFPQRDLRVRSIPPIQTSEPSARKPGTTSANGESTADLEEAFE
ncbi:mechanosensitive ion channel domain-containing protein [Planctomicrobium piriforme]|nr:mechanosensitive ion channel domain-containing protein [Planctomicrobium piriforme]